MSTPKILILTPSLGSGGAQKVFKDQLLFYSKHFATTGCIFNWDGALVEEKDFEVLSLDVPAGKNWISKFYFFCLRVIRLRAIKKKFKFDISISHLEGADYVNILSRQEEKVLCYIHGTKFHDGAIRGVLGWLRKNIFMPYLYHKADFIIPVSVGIQKEFLEEFEMPAEKIKVITNGFDIKRIEELALGEMPFQFKTLFEKHKTICLCSRLAPQKNQEIFLSIFLRVQRSVSCKLIILGDGELRSDLINQSNALGLRTYDKWDIVSFSEDYDVYFLGNQINPFPYIAQSSLFALPSSWEGFPLALCEAMACGIPVVASDCPTGPREILYDSDRNSDFGFLMPIPVKSNEDTLEVWAKTTVELLTNRSLATSYAEKAKLRVEDFSVANMEAAWLELVKAESRMKRDKILVIENSIHVTGALNSVLRTSVALRDKYDFIFVLPVGSTASAFVRENDFDVFEIPMLELSKRWQSILFYFPTLVRSAYCVRKIAKTHGVSVVHVNDFYNLIMPLWKLCGGSLKYLCYVNFVPDRFPSPLRKLWIKSHMFFSNKIITVSNHVLKQLPSDPKVICIPCALPGDQDLSYENQKKENLALFLGNFMEGKGQDLAIRAFSLIANTYPGWKLRFVGSDMGMDKNKAYKTMLINLSEELGIERQIEWCGFSEDVKGECLISSIALNFSKSESFSLTVQEAMLYGCPVIATRSGGPEELIEHDYSGLLVPVDDIKAMSKAMKYLIDSPEERSRITINAATTIRNKCSKANTIDQLDLAYRSIIRD